MPRWSARRTLAVVGATALAAIAIPLTVAPSAGAADGDPVVTLEEGTNGCQGVLPTPGSENTTKRLVAGNLEPGGTVTFEIAFPVDAADVAGRETFVITDCVFIDGTAALKYSVSFVPNTANFLLTFDLVIPQDTPIGSEYCNYAKTTAAPSDSQASNRKAGPACFFVGGDLRIIKVAAGYDSRTPLAGASFDVTCAPRSGEPTVPPVVISGLTGPDSDTVFADGAYSASGVAETGIISIAGPEGIPCTVTETDPPAGYDLPADPVFEYTIPGAQAGQETDYIEDPRTPNTTSIVTTATSGTLGDTIADAATLSGATEDAGGTITFRLFGPVPGDTPDCSGEPAFTSDVAVSGNGVYDSESFTPGAPGNYYWLASYSGDASNHPSSGECGDDGETSVVAAPSTPASSSGIVGTATSVGPSLSFVPTSVGPVAQTGAGPLDKEIGWAVALLWLGSALAFAGKRRGYLRRH